MLHSLVIRDIVLIDALTLDFAPGLTALTGETGAGKSILLDALGLALGARADSGRVRHGARRGSVTAGFTLPPDHPALALLAEQGLEADGQTLLLRRVVEAGGGSRAFVNDQPVSVALLRRLGDRLVEIHGQHDDRGLLDPASHRDLLDAFGGHAAERAAVAEAHAALDAAETALAAAERRLAEAAADADFLRHALAELEDLAPEAGEEEALAAERTRIMQAERFAGTLAEIRDTLAADGGVDGQLRGALRRLERLGADAAELLAPIVTAFDKAAIEAAEGMAALERILGSLEFDPARADAVEERLFALRALARKHRCRVDDLPKLVEDLRARLAAIDAGRERIEDCHRTRDRAARAFADAVAALGRARKAAAHRLDAAVTEELAPLKLERTRFRTVLEPLEPAQWTARGGERVRFEVSTNPGAPFGPLVRIASGGELARLVLALKVALSACGSAGTLIFDEVDRGIGGATADAVGVRLARLAEEAQVLVVTHSPQVASRSTHHFRIEKTERAVEGERRAVTSVTALDAASRREEIARMLSGARVTEEARAAATRLLERTA